jgi:peroxiredoxin
MNRIFNRYYFAGVGSGCLLSILLVVGAGAASLFFAQSMMGDITGSSGGGLSALRAPDFPSSDQSLTVEGEADWDWELATLEGESVTLGDFQGKIVFLNLCATWCGPCKREMPNVQALYDTMKDKGVVFLLVSKEDPETVQDWLADQEYDMPFYIRSGAAPADLSSSAIPATFIIDHEGTVVFKDKGSRAWDDESAIDFLDRLLADAGLNAAEGATP